MIEVFNEDCLNPINKIPDESVHLGIHDPPFGIGETKFQAHYKRKNDAIIPGYVEAPDDYLAFTIDWMREAKRVLKPDGSLYIIIGHSTLVDVLTAAKILDLHLVNQIIWKFNFGVFAKRKYVTSHYNILYFSKSKKSNLTFNRFCRFGSQEKDVNGGSLLYQDLEDVFVINKEFQHGEVRNQNKLPDELIKKIIQYSSNPDDTVCDFFLGNFTTAYVANGLGRKVTGYEINQESFKYHYPLVSSQPYGHLLSSLKVVNNEQPERQGEKLTQEEKDQIKSDFHLYVSQGHTKTEARLMIQEKYQRGKFAIINLTR